MNQWPQRLTSPTVKVRRLGYIVALTKILKRKSIPNLILPDVICRWSHENVHSLSSYCSGLPVVRKLEQPIVGEITTNDSANRYVNTAREMGFVTRIVQEWQNTKMGNVLEALPGTSNPFVLSLEQTFLLLKQLLVKDYDYLKTISEITRERMKISGEVICFMHKTKSLLSAKYKNAMNMPSKKALKDAIREISGWRKPEEYYAENIKAPRLEWLVDLKLISKWHQRINYVGYREGAETIFQNEVLNPTQFENDYPRRFYSCYKGLFKKPVEEWNALSIDEKRDKLSVLLEKSVKTFKPLEALDKVSADQFFTFATCLLLTEDSTLSSLEEIERDLINFTRKGELPYRYVRMISDVDRGYIVRTRSR